MTLRVLLVEDDRELRRTLGDVLTLEGHLVRTAASCAEALALLTHGGSHAGDAGTDLVLLDLGLPDLDGVEVCRRLRNLGPMTVIVVLSARVEDVDVVLGLESGADDYVMKPFKPKELVARVRARLRRNDDEPAEMLSIADIDIDVPAHKVTRDGEQISLTPLEFDLLVALAR